DHDDRDDEADDEADRDRAETHAMRPGENFVMVLGELERRRSDYGRDGEEEAELGRGAALDAERERAHDRRSRAAHARDHRQALDDADPDRGRGAPPRDSDYRRVLHHALDDDDRDPAEDERDRDK